MRMKTYSFKRDIEETHALSASAPEGWNYASGANRIYNNMGFALGSLGATSAEEFQKLFRLYRIVGVRMRLYFSQTASANDNNKFSNSQLMVRMAPNHQGKIQDLNNAYWQQVQAKKYRLAFNGGKPIDVYMPLKMRTQVDASSSATSVALSKPKFVPSNDLTTLFEGLNTSIERVDGQAFTSNSSNQQYVKIIYTLYFQCRGVE
eukprot:COSAG01_NODE_11924_length_1834_cov_656.183862_2_plen_205_part_00